MQHNIFEKKFLVFPLLFGLIFIFTFTVSFSEAHVLVIADADETTPDSLNEAQNTANALKSKGYNVLELYKENATTENIMKGMYNADAVIYAGHGGYMTGNYDGNGGPATPPFALVGSDGFVWGVGDKLREGWDGKLVTAPFKQNIPVILAHACFSTGWVNNKEVSNPTETIYNFSLMFGGAGANYYATGYYGSYQGQQVVDLIDEFLNGATSFADANQKNNGKIITKSTTNNGKTIWRNDHGYAAFVGNWNATFPKASQTTPYNPQAAENWYNGINGGDTDNISPTITSTNPSSGATGFSTTLPIIINFSENVVAGVNFAGIYIKNLTTGKLVSVASKSINSGVLTIKQTLTRLNNNLYQVYIPAGAVKDVAGNNLASAYMYQFQTASGTVDTAPPTVKSTSPTTGGNSVSRTSPVTINFSENVVAGVNYAGIYIKNLTTGKLVSIASKTINGSVLTLKQSLTRLSKNLYQVYIPAGAVKDVSGNSIKSSYSFQFRSF